ncbi:hypothetical protein D1871_02715 [Nakamurella silvestris]|nr:hypothetical protein D1871_02715 [Nakamurella silvestris]
MSTRTEDLSSSTPPSGPTTPPSALDDRATAGPGGGPLAALRRRRQAHVPLRHRIREAGGILRFLEVWVSGERHGRYGFATIRIGLGAVLTGYLIVNLADAPRVWGPGSAWMGNLRQDNLYGWPFNLAQKAAESSIGFSLWYLATLACGIALILGWRTRILIPVLYVLFTGLISLNPVVTDNGDLTCRLLLLYLAFADASGVWSLDARRRARARPSSNPTIARYLKVLGEIGTIVHNFVLVVVVINLCLIYWTAGLLKLQEPLWREGTAVYYPLAIRLYQPWPALSQFAWGTDFGVHLVTYGSLTIQLLFPILILSRYTRWLALMAAIGLHLGIAVLMGLASFSGFMALMDAILISSTSYLWLEGKVLVAAKKVRAAVLPGGPEQQDPEQQDPEQQGAVADRAGPARKPAQDKVSVGKDGSGE